MTANKSRYDKKVNVYIYTNQGQAPFITSAYILIDDYWCSVTPKSGLQAYVGNQGENVIDAVFTFDSAITIPNDALLQYPRTGNKSRFYKVTAVVAKSGQGAQEVYAVYADDSVINLVSGSAVLPSGSSTFSATVNYALTSSFLLGSVESASYSAFAVSASYAPAAPQVSSSYANSSSFASIATSASFAQKAVSASYAPFQVSSSYAGTSSFATSASYAPQLPTISASFAQNANTASLAVAAISASYAPQLPVATASFAVTAGSASYAPQVPVASASYASNAGNANTATSASYAPQLPVATASFATTALSASYAPQLPVATASFASTALSASYAPQLPVVSASYATNAGNANTATSASFATSASWAPGSGTSTSASYASTASYATLAQNVLGSIANATSASYAATASLLLGSVASALTATSASYAATASVYLGSVVSASYATSASWAPGSGVSVSASYATTASYSTQTVFNDSIALNGPSGQTAAGVTNAQQTTLDIYGKPAGSFGGIAGVRMFPSGSPNTGSTVGNWNIFALADNFIPAQAYRRGNFEFYNVLKLAPAFTIDSSSRMGINAGYNQPFLAELTIFGASPAQPVVIVSASTGQTADVFQIRDAANVTRFKVDSNYNVTSNLIGSASSATSASYALSASWAPGSGASISASYATTASYATVAQNVLGAIANATSASYALSASWAPGSGASISSSYAATASVAVVAISAATATSASWAPFQVSSSFATSASWAPQLPVASASYATNAGAATTAITASYVASASYAPQLPVVSASYATNAGTAVNAISASYAPVPVSASFATTASFAKNAATATTASYATLAQNVLGSIANATSASYAVTASYAQSIPPTRITGVTGSYTASSADQIILVQVPSATGSIYLPSVATNPGQSIWIRKVDASAFPVLVVVNGSDLIDAAYNFVQLVGQESQIVVTSDGASTWMGGGSGSYAGLVVSASFALSASWAPSIPQVSASYATTASYALNGGTGGSSNGVFGGNFSGSFSGSLSGSISATGSLLGSASYTTTSSFASVAQTLLGSVVSSSYGATASLAPKYVLKAGDTMTGNLTMGSNNLILGPANDIIQGSTVSAAGTRIDSPTGVSLCYGGNATLSLRASAAGVGISGSLQTSGSINVRGPYAVSASFFTGSLTGLADTASFAFTALSASWAPGSGASVSASYATTASYASVAQNVLGSITSAATASLLIGNIQGDTTASAGLLVNGGSKFVGTMVTPGGFIASTGIATSGIISATTASITGIANVGSVNATSLTGSLKLVNRLDAFGGFWDATGIYANGFVIAQGLMAFNRNQAAVAVAGNFGFAWSADSYDNPQYLVLAPDSQSLSLLRVSGSFAVNKNLVVTGSVTASGYTGPVAATYETAAHIALGNWGGTASLDMSQGNSFSLTLTGSTYLTVVNAPAAGVIAGLLIEIQSGSNFPLAYAPYFKFPSAAKPILTSGSTDLMAFTSRTGSAFLYSGIQKDLR